MSDTIFLGHADLDCLLEVVYASCLPCKTTIVFFLSQALLLGRRPLSVAHSKGERNEAGADRDFLTFYFEVIVDMHALEEIIE